LTRGKKVSEYAAREKLRLLEPLGIDWTRADPKPVISLGVAERIRAAELWERNGLEGQTVVAISPVSRIGFKQWGAERWAAVADSVAANGTRVILTSGPAQRHQVRAVVERMTQPVIWDTTAANVREIAAVYERCTAWAGNDGGLKHVAVAAGTPTVAVYRWRESARWSDPDAPTQYALEAPPPQGCDLRCELCPHLGCLEAVTVQRVAEAVRLALGSRSPERLHSVPVSP
jgi:ADP-heptose:LPS heptosyltransferase